VDVVIRELVGGFLDSAPGIAHDSSLMSLLQPLILLFSLLLPGLLPAAGTLRRFPQLSAFDGIILAVSLSVLQISAISFVAAISGVFQADLIGLLAVYPYFSASGIFWG